MSAADFQQMETRVRTIEKTVEEQILGIEAKLIKVDEFASRMDKMLKTIEKRFKHQIRSDEQVQRHGSRTYEGKHYDQRKTCESARRH